MKSFPFVPWWKEQVRRFIHDKGAKIQIREFYPENESAILADRSQVGLAVDHLLRNALQALGDEGDIDVTVRETEVGKGKELVADLLPGHYVVFEVRDSGGGIPEQVLPRVFEPFYTTKESGQGAGMGLAVVFAVARGFGGGVYARNLPESGAAFALYLPAMTTETSITEESRDARRAVVESGAVS